MTVNAVRRPGSKHFTRGFLFVTPGLTIKDRLRVLQPNDPDSCYASRELVPSDMLDDVKGAKIVITNYHAFKLRERTEVSQGTRAAIEGWRGEELRTLETEGQMLQRVMPDLMGMKNILAINDEGHHCYRQKPQEPDEEDLMGDERKKAEKNNEESFFVRHAYFLGANDPYSALRTTLKAEINAQAWATLSPTFRRSRREFP